MKLSPNILRMVAHQTKDGHPPSLGWSPTNPRTWLVTHQKEVYYRLGIWYFDLSQKTKARS